MGLPFGAGAPQFGGVQFVENATQDYDHGLISTIPNLFGDGEFTFKIVVTCYQVTTIGDTSGGAGQRENWSDANGQPGSAGWWNRGNFLIDGHNNDSTETGTFSLQVYNSGVVRWTFGDGSGSMPTGGVWGIQNSSGTNILVAGARHVIHCTREWSGGSDAILRLYVNGNLEDSVTSDVRTNMATSYWDSWTGYPTNEDNWTFAAEKQVVTGDLNDYEDFKGIIHEVAFYNDNLSAAEINNDQGPVDTGHADYLDHFAFREGSGTTTTSSGGISMTLGNEQSGGFWP